MDFGSVWAARIANWRYLASKQCCHPSTVATCSLSCVSVSTVCGCSRCTFWHLHTVPIELPMSSTWDLTVTEWGWLTACPFFGNDCLQLLLMQATQKWSYKTRNIKGWKLYIKTVTSSPVLLQCTISEKFYLWYNCVRSAHNALYPARCLQVFSHPLQEQERTTVCQCDWNADRFDFVRLVWRVVRRRTDRSYLLQPQFHVLVWCYCNATTSISTDVASETSRTADIILWSTQAYSDVCVVSTIIAVCTPLCPQILLMYPLNRLLSTNRTIGFKQQLTNFR